MKARGRPRLASCAAQVQTPSPAAAHRRARKSCLRRACEDLYGPPGPEDLDQIAYNGASYQKRHVIVKGHPRRPGGWAATCRCEQGAARVMLIAFNLTDIHDYSTLLGREVDVRGIVRVLPGQQKVVPCRGQQLLREQVRGLRPAGASRTRRSTGRRCPSRS